MVDIKTIPDLLLAHPLFKGLDREMLDFIAGCATNHRFATDTYLFHADDPADRFYLLRAGEVSIELAMPGRKRLAIQTLHAGSIVGATWILPPYRWRFDARATSDVRAVGIDADCLRGKCDDNPALGYEVFKRFLPVIADRLVATRMQLLDLYAPPAEVGAKL